MDYINFIKEDNAADQALIQFDTIQESTFTQKDLLDQVTQIQEDDSKPLIIDEKIYYTVHKNPWYLATQQGGCCILRKENVFVIATYDENKQQNASKFRRRMSLLDKII